MATYSAAMSDTRYTLYLDVSESNVNIADNTSVVNYTLRLGFSSPLIYGAWSSIGKYSLTINGVALASNVTFSYDFRNYSSRTLASGNLTVAHNADGSKTVGCSGYAWMDDGKGSASPSGNFVLTTIARASQPTLNVYSQALDSNITIYTNKAAAFTHTLSYVFGTQSGTIATGVVDNYAWKLPLTLANAIPSATSGTGTITCITYNGATQIGTKTVNFTATVPDNSTFKPVVGTITLTGNNLLPSGTAYIKSKSTVTVKISAPTLQYGAGVGSYKTTVNNQTLIGSEVTSSVLNTTGTNTISVTYTDSRGYTSAPKTTTIDVIDYFSPRIDIFTASRNATTNTTVNIQRKVTFPIGITSSGRLLKNGTAIYTWGTGSFNVTSAPTGFDINTAYTVTLEITDNYGTITQTINIPTGFALMNFNASGKGMAIGQVSTDNIFEVGMTSVFNETAKFNVGIYVPDCRTMPGTNTLASYVPIPSSVPDNSLTTLFSSGLGNASDWKSGILVKGWEGAGYAAWSLSGAASTTAHDDFYLQSGVGSTWRPAQKIWHSGNLNPANINAAQLGGMSATSAATASTIAARNASGHLLATYFSQSSGQENYGASSYFYEYNSDGYLRKKPLANVKTEIVTKAAIEAALTGAITSHNHAIMAPSVAITDVHAYRETGYYYGYNITNAPRASAYYTYHHMKYDGTSCAVVAYPQVISTGAGDGFIYWKMCKAGVWGEWFRINL